MKWNAHGSNQCKYVLNINVDHSRSGQSSATNTLATTWPPIEEHIYIYCEGRTIFNAVGIYIIQTKVYKVLWDIAGEMCWYHW